MTVPATAAATVVDLLGANLGPFNTVWPFEQAADVQVWIDDATEGGAWLAGAPEDYVLTAPDPLVSGGAVTLSAGLLTGGAWPPGSRLALVRGTADGQPTAFQLSAGFSPAAVGAALDHMERQLQDVRAQVAQALTYRQDEAPAALPAMSVRRGQLAVWALNGDASLGAAPLSSLAVGPAGGNVMAVGLLTGLGAIAVPAGANLIQTSGYAANGVGPARYARSANQAGPAGVTHVQTGDGAWWDLAEPLATPQMFGAAADGVTDDTAAWMSAAAYGQIWHLAGVSAFAQSLPIGAAVFVGAGAGIKPGDGVTITFNAGFFSPFGNPFQNLGAGAGAVVFASTWPGAPAVWVPDVGPA